jgi:hypothetical protein
LFFSLIASAAVLSAGGNSCVTTSEVACVPDSAIGLFGGSEGLGASYSKRVDNIFQNTVLTISIAGLSGYSPSFDDDNIHYEADVDLLNAGATLDYHPFGSGFLISVGAFYNGNKVKAKAVPRGGTFTIDGHTYTTAELGYVKGETDFNKFVPYFGIGYDNSLFGSGNWFFTARAGAIYQGSADIKLDYQCGAAATAATCAQIKKDVLSAQDSLNDKIDKYKLYPVVSIGISYRF